MPIKFGTRDEPDYEVYLHRIGRAGRFGRKGNLFLPSFPPEWVILHPLFL
jgi:superfamily II DNA/RNA helicase